MATPPQAAGQVLVPRGAAVYPPSAYVPGYPPGSDPWIGPLDPRYPSMSYGIPRSVLIERQIVPSPALPPAKIVFRHSRQETLEIEVYDRKKRQLAFRGQIAPGEGVEVALPRDAGGHVRETYLTVGAFSEPLQRQVTRVLPVAIRYDVVVHRWQIQSIAIDRTGKSPSAIEDIQGQRQMLGRFSLPAGPLLIDGRVDVYRNAVATGNRGTAGAFPPATEDDGPISDPLRQAIEELDRR